MPIHKLTANAAYSPEQVAMLGKAYEAACAALAINKADRSAAEAVATAILQHAAKGEFDPERLRDYTVHALKRADGA
jgi:hypothetical protein